MNIDSIIQESIRGDEISSYEEILHEGVMDSLKGVVKAFFGEMEPEYVKDRVSKMSAIDLMRLMAGMNEKEAKSHFSGPRLQHYMAAKKRLEELEQKHMAQFKKGILSESNSVNSRISELVRLREENYDEYLSQILENEI